MSKYVEEVIKKFVAWWKSRDAELAKELFHDKFQYNGGSRVNDKNVWVEGVASNPSQDFKLLKSYFCNNEATIILEETDEITNLYYRHSFYIQVLEGKVSEIIETKESVQK
jgi:hypothetical protein